MGFGLEQVQSQKLVMTAQMKQAIEMLQCSAFELNQYVIEQLDNNPVAELEFAPRGDEQTALEMRSRLASNGGRTTIGGARPPLEQVIHSETSLAEALEFQLRLSRVPRRMSQVARFLIGCLDESGYLKESRETVSKLLSVSLFDVGEALSLLQTFDPPGVAAESLRECLMLQLNQFSSELRDVVAKLITDHLDDVASGRVRQIASELHIPVGTVQQAVDALRRLNPRPGLTYGGGNPEYVIPDVVVERVGSSLIVVTNEAAQPRLWVNASYRRLLEQHADEETRQYLLSKVQSVEWIARCLEQRRVTLLRVAEAIVQHQQAFFVSGMAAMKPLTLRQIAERLDLHESTVSRAIRGKYMQTQRGLFEMKFFFTSEVHGLEGATSAQAVKHELKRSIEQEDPRRPLSDDALAKDLAEQGFFISRRTVAKYREELNIPTSARRRRYL